MPPGLGPFPAAPYAVGVGAPYVQGMLSPARSILPPQTWVPSAIASMRGADGRAGASVSKSIRVVGPAAPMSARETLC